MILEILEECSFGVIAYDTANFANAFLGGSQKPAGVIHTGTQQFLPEIHAVMFQQNPG